MPLRLSKLFKSKLDLAQKIHIVSDARLPLTPSPSRENLSQSSSATSNSPLFRKLPPEIRRRILVAAFGDQTIHVDLVNDHPTLKLTPQDHCGHGGLPLTAADNGSDAKVKTKSSAQKSWQWRSSVCHRNGPDPGPPGHQVQPAHDTCRLGLTGSQVCNMWPGDGPQKCRIGILGWLLTCKESYSEGIDVLFATNTFHIASRELLSRMHELFPAQRLERITSAELIWEIPEAPPWHPHGSSEMYKYLRPLWFFLDEVPAMFPNVRKLHIAIHWDGQYLATLQNTFSELFFGAMQSGIVDRVDVMVRKLKDSVEFSLALPSSMYRPRRERAKKTTKIEQASDGGKLERLWWPMHGAGRDGYWIRLGLKDLMMPGQSDSLTYGVDARLIVEDYILYARASDTW